MRKGKKERYVNQEHVLIQVHIATQTRLQR